MRNQPSAKISGEENRTDQIILEEKPIFLNPHSAVTRKHNRVRITSPMGPQKKKQGGAGKGKSAEWYEVERMIARRGNFVLVVWAGNFPLSWIHRENFQAGGPLVSEEGWFEKLPLFQPAMGHFEGLPD